MLFKIFVSIFLIQTAICAVVREGKADFSQHKVIRILPKDFNHLNQLNELKLNFRKRVDFWNPPMDDMRPVFTLIGPQDNDFLLSLNKSNIKYEISSNNFQKVIDSEREENEMNGHYFEGGFDYENKYHNYDEIKDQLHSIATQNPKATYKSVGHTYENREIPAIILTNPSNGTNESTKKTIFIECGIHAREWVSTAACLYMTNQLLTDSKNNNLLDKFEFIIVPTLNTDGYVYTWETDRTWRKTRSKSESDPKCVGADPNRNWDDAWSKEGASTDPCDDTYCGSKPFSEIESKQMSELVATRKGRIAAYFALHCFAELWMYPWGYTNDLPPNAKELDELSTIAVEAIHGSHGLTFKKGNIAKAIYMASGSSIDWVYDKCDGKLAFAIEMRDRGEFGFILPPSQIKPASEEVWAGISAVIAKI